MSTLILAGKLAVTAALAAGALATGLHATGGTTATDPSGARTARVHCARYAHVSDDLRAELKSLRAEPAGAQRRQTARQIRKDVRHGKYGEKTEIAVLRGQARRLRLLAKAPDALKSDLSQARSKPAGSERRDAVQQIWTDASAGKYGEQVKTLAGKAQEHREACTAKRADRKARKQGSGAPSSSPSAVPSATSS